VREIRENQIDRDPAIESKIQTDYLLGIAKDDENLTTLIDLSGALATEDMRTLKKMKEAA
jgi:chemotaxis signal transduction protein